MRSSVLFLLLIASVSLARAAEPVRCDVCVYGGTSGGVIAAVEAARHGKKVVLIEPTRHLGGMSSGGLGMTDNGSTETIGGLSREFYQRVYRFYTRPENWRWQKREDYLAWLPKIWGVDGPRMEEIEAQFLFEPRAAKAVFDDLVREAGVEVVLGERLELKRGVVKSGARIEQIVMESGRHADDGVALASYPLDSHGVTLYVDEKGVLHRERGFFTGGFAAFPISYRALRPRAEECENLLVVSCLSASHAAYGSVRMEPVFMMVGHAAGAAASLAIERNVRVQEVPYAALREVLLQEKQILQQTRTAPRTSAAPPAATPNEQTTADVQKLVTLGIVPSADYWPQHARKGKSCAGAEVRALLLRMAAHLDPSAHSFDAAVKLLYARKVFASPQYWIEHATVDRTCRGDHVRAIIRNFVRATTR